MMICEDADTVKLLIEPVWNRNLPEGSDGWNETWFF